MSDISLFVAGTLVTVMVAAALTLLIIGAILDGRDAVPDSTPIPVPHLETTRP